MLNTTSAYSHLLGKYNENWRQLKKVLPPFFQVEFHMKSNECMLYIVDILIPLFVKCPCSFPNQAARNASLCFYLENHLHSRVFYFNRPSSASWFFSFYFTQFQCVFLFYEDFFINSTLMENQRKFYWRLHKISALFQMELWWDMQRKLAPSLIKTWRYF